MSARCCHCRRPLGLCEVTYLVSQPDGSEDEWCEECDAGVPSQLRPSLGYVPALLRSVARGDERREADPAPELLHSPHALPLALRLASPGWPEVDRRKHPAHNARPLVERREGPRASRFNDLEGS